jgi:hypothetical protein
VKNKTTSAGRAGSQRERSSGARDLWENGGVERLDGGCDNIRGK